MRTERIFDGSGIVKVINIKNTKEFKKLLKNNVIKNTRWGLANVNPHPFMENKFSGILYPEDENFSTWEDYLPLKEIFNQYMEEDKNLHVTGEVFIRLHRGEVEVIGNIYF